MKKKVIALIWISIISIFVLGACKTEETSGNSEPIAEEQQYVNSEMVDSLTGKEESITEQVDYMAEAQKQQAAGNYGDAAILYQNEYEINGNQYALVELLDMWIKQGNDAEVKNWARIIRTDCTDMTDELREIVERSEKIQWIPIVVTHTRSRSDSYEEVVCATNLAYDAEGNIIQSNIAFHGGGFGYLSNEGAYYSYEYLGDDKVKIVTHDPIKEAEEEQYKYEKLNEYANHLNMTVEDMFNCNWDELANRALDAGINPDDIQRMMQNDTYYEIYYYDENGWLITEEEYRNEELYLVYDYYYDMSYDISLGQGGMQTEQQVRIYESYVDGDNRNWEESFWYSDYKIGMFAIIEGDEIVCDEYGNIVYRRSSSYNLYGDRIENAYRIEYAYCTPEEYMVAKESGDFNAYKIGVVQESIENEESVVYIYDKENLDLRCEVYLGNDYATYAPVFEEIVSLGDEPFANLDHSGEYWISREEADQGLVVYNGLFGDEESLDDCDYCDIGSYGESETTGAEAVYFYDGNRVIYRLNTKVPSFYVVDYSTMSVSDNTKLVDFGGIFTSSLYLVPQICNKKEIEGYIVYFSYDTYVEIEPFEE